LAAAYLAWLHQRHFGKEAGPDRRVPEERGRRPHVFPQSLSLPTFVSYEPPGVRPAAFLVASPAFSCSEL
jgi:hypothetical protein